MSKKPAPENYATVALEAVREKTAQTRAFVESMSFSSDRAPNSYGKADILEIIQDVVSCGPPYAQRILDLLVGRGDVVAKTGDQLYDLGFSNYGVRLSTTRFVLKETYEEQVDRMARKQRNKRREELQKRAADHILREYADEVESRYLSLCANEELYPEREEA